MPIPTPVISLEPPPRTVTVERGQLVLFAQAIDQRDPIYFDLESARAAGHSDLPVPPTFLFGLNLTGPQSFEWLTDLGIDLRRVLHGEQRFSYRSVAHAGDELVLSPQVVGHYTKKDGALEFLVRRTAVTRRDGSAVAELEETMIVRHPTPDPEPGDDGAGG